MEPSLARLGGPGARRAGLSETRLAADRLADRARADAPRRRLMVRLVKGAYWDSEIKRAQELGLDGYPVFTRKAATDVSYLACARKLLAARRRVLSVLRHPQRPHGGGCDGLRRPGARDSSSRSCTAWATRSMTSCSAGGQARAPVRVYAPVGEHEDLLAYLVRRLLENGANSSFVNRIFDEQLPVSALAGDPAARLAGCETAGHPKIPLPRDLFGAGAAQLGGAGPEPTRRSWRGRRGS